MRRKRHPLCGCGAFPSDAFLFFRSICSACACPRSAGMRAFFPCAWQADGQAASASCAGSGTPLRGTAARAAFFLLMLSRFSVLFAPLVRSSGMRALHSCAWQADRQSASASCAGSGAPLRARRFSFRCFPVFPFHLRRLRVPPFFRRAGTLPMQMASRPASGFRFMRGKCCAGVSEAARAAFFLSRLSCSRSICSACAFFRRAGTLPMRMRADRQAVSASCAGSGAPLRARRFSFRCIPDFRSICSACACLRSSDVRAPFTCR